MTSGASNPEIRVTDQILRGTSDDAHELMVNMESVAKTEKLERFDPDVAGSPHESCLARRVGLVLA